MRIIAGEFRGRRILAPRGKSTRPTSDRVREALFSLVGPCDGLRACDLYAGSGALAIEALSRGASYALLVERSRPALAALRQNLAALGLGARAEVFGGPAERALQAIADRAPFGLILADPPYAALPAAALLLSDVLAAAAAPDAVVALEHATSDAPPTLAGAALDRTRRYGDTAVSIYRVAHKP